jgi:hypothetical protein
VGPIQESRRVHRAIEGEDNAMGTRSKFRSNEDDWPGSPRSRGISPEGQADRDDTRVGGDGPIPDSPGFGSVAEPGDEFGGPPPEWVECYWTSGQADAASFANYLESHGVVTRRIDEPRILGAHAMTLVSIVLIRPKDLPLARSLIDRIERRRARRQRQRPAEFPWDAFAFIALVTLTFFAGLGAAIGAGIGGLIGWEQAGVVGGGLGSAIGLFLMIRLYRARKRADSAATVAGNPARGSA